VYNSRAICYYLLTKHYEVGDLLLPTPIASPVAAAALGEAGCNEIIRFNPISQVLTERIALGYVYIPTYSYFADDCVGKA